MRMRKVTRKKIAEAIAAGFGQGHGDRYQPWMRLARGGFLPRSTHGIYLAPMLDRHQHIFSRIERRANAVGLWLGAIDSREQAAVWPFPCPHPLADHEDCGEKQLPPSPGTVEIAKVAGIIHPRYPATDITYIPTIDALLTYRKHNGSLGLTAVFSKSSSVVRESDFDFRTAELAEIVRRVCGELNARFVVWDELVIDKAFSDRLIEAVTDSALPPRLSADGIYLRFLEIARARLAQESIREILALSAEQLDISVTDATRLFAHAGWTQDLPIDLSKPYLTSEPAQIWDGSWRKKMQTAFFGDIHHE